MEIGSADTPALSIMWLIFVLPAAFAEPVALAIKSGTRRGYLGVQLLTGLMFIASFLFSTHLSPRRTFTNAYSPGAAV